MGDDMQPLLDALKHCGFSWRKPKSMICGRIDIEPLFNNNGYPCWVSLVGHISDQSADVVVVSRDFEIVLGGYGEGLQWFTDELQAHQAVSSA